jgi:short subunit dehydrogenase-like uncharacterized protein
VLFHRVLISTAGPYATQDGETVIAACIATRTHYLDLTGQSRARRGDSITVTKSEHLHCASRSFLGPGETVWLRTMIDKYKQSAQSRGVCILNFCGFDSIPADIGCTVLVNSFSQLSLQHVEGSIRLRGQAASGGSMASILAFHQQSKQEQEQAWEPFLLHPTSAKPTSGVASAAPPPAPLQSHHTSADRRFPFYDGLSHSWSVPLNMMHLINTRAVRRTIAQHNARGEVGWKFTYNEHVAFGSAFGAWMFWIGITLFAALLQFETFRKIVAKFGPQPGTGERHPRQEGTRANDVLAAPLTRECLTSLFSVRSLRCRVGR